MACHQYASQICRLHHHLVWMDFYKKISEKHKLNNINGSIKDWGYLNREIYLEIELEAYKKKLGICGVFGNSSIVDEGALGKTSPLQC